MVAIVVDSDTTSSVRTQESIDVSGVVDLSSRGVAATNRKVLVVDWAVKKMGWLRLYQ